MATKRKTKRATTPKSVVRYRTKTVAKAKPRRRTGLRAGGKASNIEAMLKPALFAMAGGAAGVFVGKMPILANNDKLDALAKAGLAIGGVFVSTKQGMPALGAGFAGGIAAKVIGVFFPNLADSLSDDGEDYANAQFVDMDDLSEDEDEQTIYLDALGNPMFLDEDSDCMRYLEDGSLSEARPEDFIMPGTF